MPTTPRPNDRTPKTYTTGTGRSSTRQLDTTKVVRTVNVVGLVWENGKRRAAADQISLSHAVGVLIEAYAEGLVDPARPHGAARRAARREGRRGTLVTCACGARRSRQVPLVSSEMDRRS